MSTATDPATAGQLGGVAEDLAAASLAMARRFAAGATLWCVSPAWPHHARHVAVEFVHPVIVGKRALPALMVPPEDAVAQLRLAVRPGDIVLAVSARHDRQVADAMRRAPAWGVESIWVGSGPRPATGAANHVLWLPDEPLASVNGRFILLYHLLWELTHVCFEHPGLLKEEVCTDEVCITCSDEGRLAEVVTVEGDEAVVRTAEGTERIDTMLIEPPAPNDLVLVHAGSAIANVTEAEEEASS